MPNLFPTGCDAASQELCGKPISTADQIREIGATSRSRQIGPLRLQGGRAGSAAAGEGGPAADQEAADPL